MGGPSSAAAKLNAYTPLVERHDGQQKLVARLSFGETIYPGNNQTWLGLSEFRSRQDRLRCQSELRSMLCPEPGQ